VAAATSLAAEARRQGVSSPALVALEREIGAARALQEQRLAERLAAARQRVEAGALFEPANDNALDQLSRLQADAPALAGLAEGWEAFRAAVAAAIQRSIVARDWAAADAALTRLAQVPGGAEAAVPLAADVAAGRLQQAYLATAVPASELMLVSSVPAVYPEEAVERELEGWVDLEFVVDESGQPRGVTVVQASRPSTFNAAAIAAVERYRYAPFELNGRVYERRLRFRVRFELE
jgi:TonB family protein